MDYYNTNHVKTNGIYCDKSQLSNTINLSKREILELPLKCTGSHCATIILMNPSKADCTQSDGTVNKIIEFFYNHQSYNISTLHITNLFPIYNTQSNTLYQDILNIKYNKSSLYLKSILTSNFQTIVNSANNSKMLVLAWGDCPKGFNGILYYNTISSILDNIKKHNNIYVFDFNKIPKLTLHGNPRHPSRETIYTLQKVTVNSDILIIE
ncbi:DUF1643 domain-containing protein [Paraclostridium sordellii]|uniref:DUF1643 domain-containing protein n=1 Tax=Paraclostridium sordellii TaxID=1505 RepID=UPI0005E7E5A2|nr:DUF1643 domain-containing protein [Paeniclostridium sordellii]CEN26830.1 Uncharacterized protein conserved in bacteria [[Clostridium] sordellii] [Paeniclostridium sordellii]